MNPPHPVDERIFILTFMGPAKIPVQQLCILALCRLAEPIALTSVLPYLPALIRSFHVPEPQIAYWAGLCGTAYSAANALTALLWGRASDRYGRKYCIVAGMLCNAITALLWGFSSNLKMALVARFLVGAGNGNAGIMRTMVAEFGADLKKEDRARTFSILPMMYNLGSIIGPACAGLLANPLRRSPDDEAGQSDSLLWKYPFALPNIVCAILFLSSATLATLFLRESLSTKQDRKDYGLELGNKIRGYRRKTLRPERLHTINDEQTPLLGSDFDQEPGLSDVLGGVNKNPEPKSFKLFTNQTLIALLVYTLIPIQFFTYDQQVSWIMAYPRSGPEVGATRLPFKFSRGFGMDSAQIGFFLGASAIMGIFNMWWCPKIYGKHGIVRGVRFGLAVMPMLSVLTPFCVLPSSLALALLPMTILWLIKGICVAFAYPCSTMLLASSAPTLEVLGTINGIATAIAAVGRAIGPAIAGPAFTFGVKHDYMITSFWVMAVIGATAPIAALWSKEQDNPSERDEQAVEDARVPESTENGERPQNRCL